MTSQEGFPGMVYDVYNVNDLDLLTHQSYQLFVKLFQHLATEWKKIIKSAFMTDVCVWESI